jgi:Mg2+/citrate symporter
VARGAVPVAARNDPHPDDVEQLGSGRAIDLATAFGYLTPLEPSCLMVYGLGKYRFMDFFKVGLPLTVLIYIIAIVAVPAVWPLSG